MALLTQLCASTTGIQRHLSNVAQGWEMPSIKNASEVVTDSILDGVFASTIQPAFLTAEETSEMNDDDIERSIAEINEAINRVSNDKKKID